MTHLLKKIHNFFLLFGINISFVKKPLNIEALKHNSKENLDAFYANQENVNQYLVTERLEFYSNVVALLQEKKMDLNNKSVVDVGCGTGHLLLYISKIFSHANLYGLEYVDSALNIARKNVPSANFMHYDVYNELNQKFDFVFCTEVLEHLTHPTKGIINLVKMLYPGGVLLLTVPNGRIDTYEGHINFWSPESWKVFLEESVGGKNFESSTFGVMDLYALVYG